MPRRILLRFDAIGQVRTRRAFSDASKNGRDRHPMDGGGVPTAEQIAIVYAHMRPEIARLGYVVAANPRLAEVVVHVKFTPDLTGGFGGRISILNVAPSAEKREKAFAARDEFKDSSAKAIRSQITEPR
jgi:hypothetical protein